MFTRRQIVVLLIPLMLEQVLSGLMGIADTIMVTSVGETAISAVSLVDSINTLVLQLFAALAAGGVIVCAQYLGRGEADRANDAARQVMLAGILLGAAAAAFCLLLCGPMLRLIFGEVEELVMTQAADYFLITAMSYPFLAAQQSAAAIFRSDGHSAPPMVVAAAANAVNIAGNAVLIFVFGLGVVGAALATLASRIVSAAALLVLLRSPKLKVSVRDYRHVRPDRMLLGTVLRVGIPTGVENAMFQLGKLLVQSTVSTMGVTAMAAQAMTHTLNMVQCMPSQAIGLGLLTVASQCMGAGRENETRRYVRQFCVISEAAIVVVGGAVLALTPTITTLSRMTAESAAMTFRLMSIIAVVKAVLWVPAFTLPYGMRAAGDVRFAAVVSALSMWILRVGGCLALCRGFGVGLIGVWIAWFADWGLRMVVYVWRYRSGRWAAKQVIRS